MAFNTGKTVRKGDTGEVLSVEKSVDAAKAKVRALHKEHNPKQGNRGAVAKKRYESKKSTPKASTPKRKSSANRGGRTSTKATRVRSSSSRKRRK